MNIASVVHEMSFGPGAQVLLALTLALLDGVANQDQVRVRLLEVAAHPETSDQVRQLIVDLINAVARAQQEASHA